MVNTAFTRQEVVQVTAYHANAKSNDKTRKMNKTPRNAHE
jgi:hypothetical protein